jgi:predicted Zn-dependent protease
MAQGANQLPGTHPWLRAALILALLAVAGVAAFLVYRKYEPDRLTRQAREYVAKGDYRSAVLAVRRALAISPRSQSASRLMAEITEQLQVPDALDWRRRIAELNPGSTPDALAWVDTALRMHKTAAAEQALASVPEGQRDSASYHSKAGTVALSSGKWRDAEKHYAEALKREPSNELHQYNYATLQLQSPDAAQRKTGTETLDRLARGGRVQAFAQRALITRLSREGKWDEALDHSAALLKDSTAQFGDRLVHLELLRRLNKPEFATELADTLKLARADAEQAALLVNWLRSNALTNEALRWVESLEPAIGGNARVAAARAECLTETRNWGELRKLVGETNWATDDDLRLAYLARALREQNEIEGSKVRWAAAVSLAAKTRESASRLAYLATRWGWDDEAREILWAAVNAPAPEWALQILHRLCQAEGDTEGLLRVATRFVELDPGNDSARNNVAMLSLLLGRDVAAALAIARELHSKASSNPVFASTYAFALHLQGQSEEALRVMKDLPPEELRNPPTAAYYGLLLAATGKNGEAQPYLELGKAARLLPEEKALLMSASNSVK